MSPAHRTRWFVIFALLAAVTAGIGFVLARTFPLPGGGAMLASAEAARSDVSVTAEGIRYVIDPALLVEVLPEPDGIPPIESPQFESPAEADAWLSDDDPVVALKYAGETRVYPLKILVWHEVVNDVVAGTPLLITYCPLAGSVAAYKRSVAGRPATFGTSGKLYNSNLVLYDRATDSYWTQIDGLAVVGDAAGSRLESVDVDTVAWGAWKLAHPQCEVLSRLTGYTRDYSQDPYESYCSVDYVLFPVAGQDHRTSPKSVVYVVTVNGESVAYREQDLAALEVIEDRIQGTPVRLSWDADGAVRVVNRATREDLGKKRSFWFAWYAFHPETRLFLPAGR